jgi:hypothetical protein
LSVLAVVLQVVGAAALIVGAALAINVWAGVAVGGVVVFAFGEALERR